MSKIYMITCARNNTCKRALEIAYQELDGKRGIYARETGNGGYEHWQCRFELSGDLREWNERNGCGWHIEDANDVWDYEQKDGDCWNTWDTVEIRKIRYGKPRRDQMEILRSLNAQNDRMVTIWVDPKGGAGKTWNFLRGVLRGDVLPVPAAGISSTKLSGWVHSAWKRQPIIWIDIPRAHEIDKHLWETIEEVKGGIAYEWRYASSWIVTSGVKILVTTNSEIDEKNLAMLSKDRWDIHHIAPYYVTDGAMKNTAKRPKKNYGSI